MAAKVARLQRTLVVALDEVGLQAAAALTGRLAALLGPAGVIGLVLVSPGEKGEDETEPAPFYLARLAIPTGDYPEFSRWRQRFEETVAAALQQISSLAHLDQLARQGRSLANPDEVHLVLIAGLAGRPGYRTLTTVAGALRECVARTLGCQAGLTGLLLSSALNPGPVENRSDEDPASSFEEDHRQMELGYLFDRGCYLAGPTNEAGLTLGDTAALAGRAAHFLALLMVAALEPGQAGSETTLDEMVPASFGLAAVQWPGRAVAGALSRRQAGEILARLTAAPPAGEDWVRQAREAAQGLVLAERVAPPLLLEHISDLVPALPDLLAGQVPDEPWPWLLQHTPERLEEAARAWEEGWLAARREADPGLSGRAGRWREAGRRWLQETWAGRPGGAVLRCQANLAAMTDLLQAFAGGVEERLAETETDLAAVEQQIGKTARALDQGLGALPSSPLAAVLKLGWRPWHWLRALEQCRQLQATARQMAHLVRHRLLLKRAAWLLEETVPFYQQLAADWAGLAHDWGRRLAQVSDAAGSPALTGWPDQLAGVLSTGPWTVEMVEAWYKEILAAEDESWSGSGCLAGLFRPGGPGLTAEEILARLAEEAAETLLRQMAVPLETVLARQFPAEPDRAAWLAALVAQASPFWPFDEAALGETARAQVRTAAWLLAPHGPDSSLAGLVKDWPRPPVLATNPAPQELAAVSVRWGVSLQPVD